MDSLSAQRILITGANGQIGAALVTELRNKCELITATRTGDGADVAIDLSNLEQIESVIRSVKPNIVINTAAYTQVDQAEDETELAFLINGRAPNVLARVCKSIDATLIHYSSDYVFSGDNNKPYSETDPENPINSYGASKLAGEKAIQEVDCKHVIFRTCWVYDADSNNFSNAIISQAKVSQTLKVVNDQIGTPTSAQFVAEKTCRIVEQCVEQKLNCRQGNRIYNLRPDGECTWYEFAEAVLASAKLHELLVVNEMLPVRSCEFPTRAKRPSWSVLDNAKLTYLLGSTLGSWQHYLEMCLRQKYQNHHHLAPSVTK